MKNLLFYITVAISSVLLNACCANTQCDCITPAINLRYQDNNMDCNGLQNLTSVSLFSTLSGDLIQEDHYVDRFDCILSIPYEKGVYWVIQSDSLDISDTVRVQNIFFTREDVRCCDCPDIINSVAVEINGVNYFSKDITLTY